jgi:transcription antitermination factor NusG
MHLANLTATVTPIVHPPVAQWYALHTRSRHEKKVAAEVAEKGFFSFLPCITKKHRWSDRIKLVELPLFPGYVFVQTAASPEHRLSILTTPGVVSFVGSQGRGAPIPEEQIESVRSIVEQEVPFVLYPGLVVNQRVRIRGGCLDGLEGVLVAKHSDLSLVVSIELIQRSIAIRVNGYDLEPV